MPEIIRSFNEISKGWLEEILKPKLETKKGSVDDFKIKWIYENVVSHLAIIEQSYKNPDPALPASVFVKNCQAQSGG